MKEKIFEFIKKYKTYYLYGFQILAIIGLIFYIILQTKKNYTIFHAINLKGLKTNITNIASNIDLAKILPNKNGKVAGMYVSKDYHYIPKTINISISNRTKTFAPKDFNFHYLSSTDKLSEDQIDKAYLSFSQSEFEKWLLENFGDMQTDTKIHAEIDYSDKEDSLINECKKGTQATRLPIKQIYQYFLTTETLEDNISFNLENYTLSDEEIRINQICEQISIFEDNISRLEIEPIGNYEAKEIPFLSKEQINTIFKYYDKGNSIVVDITNQDLFKEQLQILKKEVDIIPENYDYRIIENTMYILGEYREGRILNIDETYNQFINKLTSESESNYLDLVYDDPNEMNSQNSSIQNTHLPKLIGHQNVRIPISKFDRINNVKNLTDVIDGILLNSGETFSLLQQLENIDKEKFYNPIHIQFENNKIMYYDNTQIIATVLYRTALETGLPITERLNEIRNVNLDIFQNTYENILITTSPTFISDDIITNENQVNQMSNEESESKSEIEVYDPFESINSEEKLEEVTEDKTQQTEGKETNENINHILKDFSFSNDTPYPVFIISKQSVDPQGNFLLEVLFYSNKDYEHKSVELYDFSKSEFSNDGISGFTEKFTRKVNGKQEVFLTNYYN